MKYGAETGQSGATNIVKLPLAFVRSGYVHLGYGYVRSVGYEAYVRSRTAKSSTDGRHLWFAPTDVYPSNYNYRWFGVSLRCLYPGK